jgi:Tol biopolymer transport system component
MDMATGGLTRITFDPATHRFPVWSPDGTRIVYSRSQSYLLEKPITGGGERQLNGVLGIPTDWSRDGRSILMRSSEGDLWAITDGKPIRITETPFSEGQGQLSPDGKWLAFVSNETRQTEVYVQAFPAGVGKAAISTGGGLEPRWRGDGTELFYVAADGKLMSVAVNGGAAGFEHAAPVPLFDLQISDVNSNGYDYLADRDGQRFLVRTPAKGAQTSPVTVVTNWLSLARK